MNQAPLTVYVDSFTDRISGPDYKSKLTNRQKCRSIKERCQKRHAYGLLCKLENVDKVNGFFCFQMHTFKFRLSFTSPHRLSHSLAQFIEAFDGGNATESNETILSIRHIWVLIRGLAANACLVKDVHRTNSPFTAAAMAILRSH